MKIQQIRNATLRITYAEQLFVTDPMLSPKYAIESFADVSRNPVVDLPCTPEEVLEGIEMVIVSHLHKDHFDQAAQNLIPKDMLMFCQPCDEKILNKKGFQSVKAIERSVTWRKVVIIRTSGKHGVGAICKEMGNVSGFIFKADNEPTVYWTGDTIWCEDVQQTMEDVKPDIIITHSSGAKLPGSDVIIMDAEQTLSVCRAAQPEAIVVATHMEALDHVTVSRAGLRLIAEREGISSSKLLIPMDGEMLHF